MAQAEKQQQVLGFYESEPEAAIREAVETYWRSYANELERQYAAQRIEEWASRLAPPMSTELDLLWKKIFQVLDDAARKRHGLR